MKPNELTETTLDPETRTLLRVMIDSNLEADKTFEELLGKDPAARFRFIMESATQVGTEELDV
jgi:DNA gyrase/topoisomerase IV subunit B